MSESSVEDGSTATETIEEAKNNDGVINEQAHVLNTESTGADRNDKQSNKGKSHDLNEIAKQIEAQMKIDDVAILCGLNLEKKRTIFFERSRS